MRVSAISSLNNYQKNVSSKGLWGRTSCTSPDIDRVLNVPKIEYTYYYYPFKDDTREEVQKNHDETEIAKVVYTGDNARYEIHDFKEGYTFPFTKAEYEAYLKVGSLKPIPYKEIEKLNVIRYNLKEKFTDKQYGTNQDNFIADTSTVKQELIDMGFPE